jgi:hypothetical protein
MMTKAPYHNKVRCLAVTAATYRYSQRPHQDRRRKTNPAAGNDFAEKRYDNVSGRPETLVGWDSGHWVYAELKWVELPHRT